MVWGPGISYDYQHAVDSMLELTHTGSVEEYATEFEALQLQITMFDQGMSETYFVSQFINGLKSEICYAVQGQVPGCMERAVMLAKIQQKIHEKECHQENWREDYWLGF